MLADLAAAFVINTLAMLVHLGATVVVMALVRAFQGPLERRPYVFVAIVLSLMNTILLTAHIAEIGMWAFVYFYLGLTESFSNAFYSACVISTTLGLGDVAPALRTRLVMPLSAASGILMFGWSTALLVYVLQIFLPHHVRRK